MVKKTERYETYYIEDYRKWFMYWLNAKYCKEPATVHYWFYNPFGTKMRDAALAECKRWTEQKIKELTLNGKLNQLLYCDKLDDDTLVLTFIVD